MEEEKKEDTLVQRNIVDIKLKFKALNKFK